MSVDPAYDYEFDKLADLCRDFLAARGIEDVRERQERSLLLAGMMLAQHASIYNLSPPAGILNPGDLFRRHDSPQVEPPPLPEVEP